MPKTLNDYGIRHLSASSLNTWIADPALWIMEKLLGSAALVGVAADRGSSVERGSEAGLLDPSLPVADCVEIALKEYDRRTALKVDRKRDDEREAIPGYVEQALELLRPYGPPSGCQEKITLELPGVSVPLIGYTDWSYDTHGMCVDLKTTGRLNTSIKVEHCRQLAIYARATNRAQRIAYVTPKKAAVYELEDPAAHLAVLTEAARKLERFISKFDSAEEMCGAICPNYESFRWSSPEARAIGVGVFGM